MGNDIYVGLDIGTDSVGYAVTDTEYNLVKHKGEPMWGVTVFEAANTKAERRGFRSARRRLDRRQQRIVLTQEIFAKAIAEVDDKFYLRLQESALLEKDTQFHNTCRLFCNAEYTDKDYHAQYPTIHHLIQDLISDKSPKDVRLVYMAVAWLMAHRGHFLNEVDKRNISQVTDFDIAYNKFEECCVERYGTALWECDKDAFGRVLKQKISVTRKEAEFCKLLNGGKKFKDAPEDEISKAGIIKLLSGGKLKPEKLFLNSAYDELESVGLGMPEENFAMTVSALDEDGEMLLRLRELYDWALLAEILEGAETVSAAKVKIYEQHQNDLAYLKQFVRKYIPHKYNEIFRDAEKGNNYASYSGHNAEKKCNKEVFLAFLKKQLKDISVAEEDMDTYDKMMERIDGERFLPKQVDGDNRVIPYQLYWDELNAILQNARFYLPFLDEVEDGYSNLDKLLSIFEFRVPYYVGPLRTDNSSHAWMKRKAEGKIYPWNFKEKVDLDASEEAFIQRMTNKCSYLPQEDVLPKSSLLYSKFMVLNEINNIKVNDVKIPVEVKWLIYDKFKEYRKVTPKKIQEVLIANGCMKKEGDILSGLDVSVKSSLSSYHAFKHLLDTETLSETEVEDIIQHMTYTEDKVRLRAWIAAKYSKLSQEEQKYISRLKFKEFGRLSRRFLQGIQGVDKETGELVSIMDALWNSNNNLMQILSDKYTFSKLIDEERQEYYDQNGTDNIEKMLDDMYISNSVKRPIYRALAILEDIKKATKKEPKRIFIEMARGGGEKKKRTVSRRDQIKDLYASFDREEVRELSKLLDSKSDNELQSEVLFLYFMQMGKCMYSGETIDIEQLRSSKYNVDHIYPQSKVKDDSINNKVLVLSTLNDKKKDNYPVPSEYRSKMASTWKALHDKKMMSDEKYRRLMRVTSFSEDELRGFINRQLVETRQSTKALANILQQLYPNTEIVYVKAGLVSDFRHEYGVLKSRAVNDLHHGKDAYLNIVCGNVYHCRFTKNFSTNSQYSLKIKTLFGQTVMENQRPVWNGQADCERVLRLMKKNNLHYTRFSFGRKGGLFDQMAVKKGKGAVPRKSNLPMEDYGGYNKSTGSFYLLVKYREKKKTDIMIMPVDLYMVERINENEEVIYEYAKNNIAFILGKKPSDIEVLGLPLGTKRLKVNTVFEMDGFRVALAGKSSGGTRVILSSLEPLKLSDVDERYVKRLERYVEKNRAGVIHKIDSQYDFIDASSNLALFDTLLNKFKSTKYRMQFWENVHKMESNRDKFEQRTLEEQILILLNIIDVFRTGRTTPCDLKIIEGGSAILVMSSKLSNWKKRYQVVCIIDVSPSGIYEHASDNLMELVD